MRKETENAIRLSLVVSMFALTSCGAKASQREESPGSESPIVETANVTHFPTPTPFQPVIETATPAVTSLFPENPTFTPTPEINPFLRGEIDFGKPGKIDFYFSAIPQKKSSSGSIVVYPDVFEISPGVTPDTNTTEGKKTRNDLIKKWLNENFHPSQDNIVSEKDSLGNVILFIHDADWNGVSLPAEFIRSYLEGYFAKTINNADHIKATMQSLVDTEVTISQGENLSNFKILAIVQIPADQVALYDLNTKDLFENVLTISQKANKTDGADEIIDNYVKFGGGTAISICGWGYVDGKLNPTQTRYLIIIEPKPGN